MTNLIKNKLISIFLIGILLSSLSVRASLITIEHSVDFHFESTESLTENKTQSSSFFLYGFDSSLGQLQEIKLSLDSFLGLDVNIYSSGLKTCTGSWGCALRGSKLEFSSEAAFEQNVFFDLLTHNPNGDNNYGNTNTVTTTCNTKMSAQKNETVAGGCLETEGNAYTFDFDLTSADFDMNLNEFIGGKDFIEIMLTNQVDFLGNNCDVGRNSICEANSNLNAWMGELSVSYSYLEMTKTTAVPEPSSLILFIFALLFLPKILRSKANQINNHN